MPKPFRLQSSRPLPPDAEIVDHDGKPHVRIKIGNRPVLCRLTKNQKQYLRPSKRWYFEYRDAKGVLQRVKGFTDLKATEQLAAEMERKVAKLRAGIIDPSEEHLRRPLAEHLKDYAVTLEAKGATPEHIRLVSGRISSLLAGCGFVFPLDADAARVAEWLNELRRDDNLVNFPDRDTFTPAEVASLLGISSTAVRASVKRLGLAATGNGKARRYPRATVEALIRNRAKGCGPETINHYVRAVRGFFRWLVKAKRIGSNPLESLALVNSAVDVRRARRELTVEELRQLFDATRKSSRSYRGLTGEDRYHLYLVAAGTGFRASALASLSPNHFALDSTAPTVSLAARNNKSRRTKIQPLPLDVAEALRGYLRDKPVDSPVWGGTWAKDHKAAEMLRGDLEAANIPYAVEGPDGPEYADFHSLRHSFLTLGGRSGIDLRTLQELAGHSKPELTARYSHRRLYDLTGAVEKLPSLVPTPPPEVIQMPLLATGTNGIGVENAVVPGVVTGRAEPHSSASSGTLRIVGGYLGEGSQDQESQGFSVDLHSSASKCNNEDDGTRTRNLRRDRPTATDCKPLSDKQLTTSEPSICSAGRSGEQNEGGIVDSELAALVAAWPTLPEPIRVAIKVMVATVTANAKP